MFIFFTLIFFIRISSNFHKFFLEIPFSVFHDHVKFNFWDLLNVGARAFKPLFWDIFFKFAWSKTTFLTRRTTFLRVKTTVVEYFEKELTSKNETLQNH